MALTQKIVPFLWFDDNAEEAVTLYTSVFGNSSIVDVSRYSGEGAKHAGKPEGTAMSITFKLEGQEFQDCAEWRPHV
jgi:predicted 3-demethylubiquinone-9 3-methyltransferase (glyoxalase superfamily)